MALGVIRGRKFVENTVFGAELREIAAELWTPIAMDGRRSTKRVEPRGEDANDGVR